MSLSSAISCSFLSISWRCLSRSADRISSSSLMRSSETVTFEHKCNIIKAPTIKWDKSRVRDKAVPVSAKHSASLPASRSSCVTPGAPLLLCSLPCHSSLRTPWHCPTRGHFRHHKGFFEWGCVKVKPNNLPWPWMFAPIPPYKWRLAHHAASSGPGEIRQSLLSLINSC